MCRSGYCEFDCCPEARMFSMNNLLLIGRLVFVGCFFTCCALVIIKGFSVCRKNERRHRESGKTTSSRIKNLVRSICRYIGKIVQGCPLHSCEEMANQDCVPEVSTDIEPEVKTCVVTGSILARYDCRLAADPLLDITWSHDAQEMQMKRVVEIYMYTHF